MKKSIIIIFLIILSVQIVACDSTPIIDDKVRLTGNEYVNTDYGIYSGNEIELRSTFEFLNIYLDSLKNEVVNKEENVEKYGVQNFWRMNDFVHFNDFDSMSTVLSNKDFQKDYFENNGIPIIKSYYLPKGQKARFNAAGLLIRDGKRYFDILGMNGDNDPYTRWGVYDVQGRKSLKEILSFYQALDNLTMNTANTDSGYPVYYFPYKDSTLFCAIWLPSTKTPHTAYIWEQDGVIGVIILPGEHKAENLDLCVLEKHEL